MHLWACLLLLPWPFEHTRTCVLTFRVMFAHFPWRADIFNMTAAPRKVSEERLRSLVRSIQSLWRFVTKALLMLPLPWRTCGHALTLRHSLLHFANIGCFIQFEDFPRPCRPLLAFSAQQAFFCVALERVCLHVLVCAPFLTQFPCSLAVGERASRILSSSNRFHCVY